MWKHLKADTVGRSAIQGYADFKAKVKSSMHSGQAQRRENPLLLPKGHAQIRRMKCLITSVLINKVLLAGHDQT